MVTIKQNRKDKLLSIHLKIRRLNSRVFSRYRSQPHWLADNTQLKFNLEISLYNRGNMFKLEPNIEKAFLRKPIYKLIKLRFPS